MKTDTKDLLLEFIAGK